MKYLPLSGIYKITNLINGKSYVGKSHDILSRWFVHYRTAKRLHNGYVPRRGAGAVHRAMNKYGIENFKFDMLFIFPTGIEVTDSMLSTFEIFFIADQNTHIREGWGYNITKGGEGSSGFKLSDEAKEKISKANKRFGKDNPFYGKHYSEETKQRIRNKSLGKCRMSAEKIKERNDKLRGRQHVKAIFSEEQHRKRSCPVECVNTGEFYMSCGVAGSILNLYPLTIRNAARKNRSTRDGRCWRFITWNRYDELRYQYPLFHIDPVYLGGKTSYKSKGRSTILPVRCVETGVLFNSTGEATKYLHVKGSGTITNAIKSNRKIAGFHWEYASREEYESFISKD